MDERPGRPNEPSSGTPSTLAIQVSRAAGARVQQPRSCSRLFVVEVHARDWRPTCAGGSPAATYRGPCSIVEGQNSASGSRTRPGPADVVFDGAISEGPECEKSGPAPATDSAFFRRGTVPSDCHHHQHGASPPTRLITLLDLAHRGHVRRQQFLEAGPDLEDQAAHTETPRGAENTRSPDGGFRHAGRQTSPGNGSVHLGRLLTRLDRAQRSCRCRRGIALIDPDMARRRRRSEAEQDAEIPNIARPRAGKGS